METLAAGRPETGKSPPNCESWAKYLKSLKETANSQGMRIYVGAGSISENSVTFSNKFGSAETLLVEGIRVAQTVGSPAVNVRIGKVDDRYTEGVIEARIQEAVKVLKALRSRAQDAGVGN